MPAAAPTARLRLKTSAPLVSWMSQRGRAACARAARVRARAGALAREEEAQRPLPPQRRRRRRRFAALHHRPRRVAAHDGGVRAEGLLSRVGGALATATYPTKGAALVRVVLRQPHVEAAPEEGPVLWSAARHEENELALRVLRVDLLWHGGRARLEVELAAVHAIARPVVARRQQQVAPSAEREVPPRPFLREPGKHFDRRRRRFWHLVGQEKVVGAVTGRRVAQRANELAQVRQRQSSSVWNGGNFGG